MEHLFSMTTAVRGTSFPEGHQLRSGITPFLAETELGPSPQLGLPETIAGRLVPPTNPMQLTAEQFFQFNFRPGVEVSFEGRTYTFSKLEKDGTFELSLIPVP